MSELKNGALYIRVSTDKQEELSPDAQRRVLLDYAKNNDILISPEYIYQDDGISGRNAEKRPMFQQMIGHAKSKEHPFDVILVWKFSRFARNQEESIVYKSMLKRDKVDVISVSEPLIDGPFGSLIERIIEWMDEYYSIRLSGEVMRGMTEKALRGGYQATAPIGYTHVKSGIPIINSNEAQIVKRIFSEYLSGYDLSTITRRLNDDGYKTRRGYPFEYRVIRYILENPFYIGKVRWNYAKHSSWHKNDAAEIIIAKGQHEPIISVDDFEKVQERLKKEFRPARRKGIVYSQHWLCGILKCGYCGSNLAITHHANGDTFQCYKYAKGQHRGSCSISAAKASDAILETISSCIGTGNIAYNYAPAKDSSDNRLAELKQELAKLDTKEKRIKLAYEDGIDTLEEYKANKSRLNNNREQIYELINSITSTDIIDYEKLKPKILNKCQNVYDILCSEVSTEEKSSAIRSICESITYDKENQNFDIVFYIS